MPGLVTSVVFVFVGTTLILCFLLIRLLLTVRYRYIAHIFFHYICFCIFLNVLTTLDVQPTIGPDGKRKEPESNVLLATIENMQYAVTVDVLQSVRILFLIKRAIYT